VAGDLWAEAKAGPLRVHRAIAFVGDHIGDMAAARAAGVTAVAVSTGPVSAPDLAAAGADVVLPDLTAFPGWLARLG
jgi:phosphoglycolate phosphatase-like HAD superfamily hydrolase